MFLGQGDLLTGLTSLYSHWNNQRGSSSYIPLILASVVTRQATFRAYQKNKYGFMTSQSIPCLLYTSPSPRD